MKFRAIIQARLDSARLQNKILEDVGGSPLLEHITNRLNKISEREFSVVIACPVEDQEVLRQKFSSSRIKVVGGDTFDVLSRYLNASQDLLAEDYIIRLTGDNPFPDLGSFESCINFSKSDGPEYFYPTGLPLGMGFEFFRASALRSLLFRDLQPHHKEHVTIYFREHKHLYDIAELPVGPFVDSESGKHYRPDIRLTVDEPDDLEMVRKTFLHFQQLGNPMFGARDVSALYAHMPGFFRDNLSVQQKSATSVDLRNR
ncbi:MAG: hypothetical protein KDK41_04125 [Leptospiraceae bacterium]|nr:hypothetical protein [Leptospiraceae bacterium]MCB1199807.1 hypothetical protein [Leptospiraceae bacterium]